jgi:2-oxo-4-hydroxy-4-carboxy--5-ureidoimidazoline (OHCU) decarboxylase
MQRRLGNSRDDEFETALGEVEKIARIRIDALIDD